MKRRHLIIGVLGAALLVLLGDAPVHATPSTIIWIPSTDIQPFTAFHLHSDVYFRTRTEPNGSMKAPLYLIGPTVGILPWEKLQMEVGFDLMFQASTDLDSYPIYFHGKIGTPEDSLFKWSPAVAAGIYNIGVKSGQTTQDIVYGVVARTVPYVGRFSFGYFWSQLDAGPDASLKLVDELGRPSNHGFLASWERTMKEITPKLWLAVDYQGSTSWMGSVNFGVAWSFTDKISMILGYDLYVNRRVVGNALVAGRDTINVQLDINFDRIAKPKPIPKPVEPPGPTEPPGPATPAVTSKRN